MDALGRVKGWIGGLTEIGLMLLALAIVAALLVGSNLPFFGNVTGNIMALVKSLGDAGLVGLIALGVIVGEYRLLVRDNLGVVDDVAAEDRVGIRQSVIDANNSVVFGNGSVDLRGVECRSIAEDRSVRHWVGG